MRAQTLGNTQCAARHQLSLLVLCTCSGEITDEIKKNYIAPFRPFAHSANTQRNISTECNIDATGIVIFSIKKGMLSHSASTNKSPCPSSCWTNPGVPKADSNVRNGIPKIQHSRYACTSMLASVQTLYSQLPLIQSWQGRQNWSNYPAEQIKQDARKMAEHTGDSFGTICPILTCP